MRRILMNRFKEFITLDLEFFLITDMQMSGFAELC
jgi:hypothetical protein